MKKSEEKTTAELSKSELRAACAEIGRLLTAAEDALVSAGEAVVRLLQMGWTLNDVREGMPVPVCLSVLEGLAKVGYGKLDHRLLADRSAAGLRMRKLPMGLQTQLLDNGVELVVLKDGTAETLRCETKHLSAEQVRQVFDNGAVRTPEAQRVWLLKRTVPAGSGGGSGLLPVLPPYRMSRGMLVWTKECPKCITKEMAAAMVEVLMTGRLAGMWLFFLGAALAFFGSGTGLKAAGEDAINFRVFAPGFDAPEEVVGEEGEGAVVVFEVMEPAFGGEVFEACDGGSAAFSFPEAGNDAGGGEGALGEGPGGEGVADGVAGRGDGDVRWVGGGVHGFGGGLAGTREGLMQRACRVQAGRGR